ncbi:MAG: hypothetical protein H6607_00235 [Flavobacteriales bacterium]|nr:hypothetical protein [Flavobacteriales bacterium]
MTLNDIFEMVKSQPTVAFLYLFSIPVLVIFTGWISTPKSNQNPWRYVYAVLLYMVCLPGVLALVFNLYQFLFERRSILDADINIQFLPIISMIVSLYFANKKVRFTNIPGMGKLSTFLLIMFVLIGFLWVMDRTFIIAFAAIPIQFLLTGFLLGFGILLIGSKRLLK